MRLCLRRADTENDSGRGSPVGATPSLKRRRNRKGGAKQSCGHPEGLHPRRLAELGGFDREEFQEYELRRLEADQAGGYIYGEKTYATTQEAGHVRRRNGTRTCSGTGTLHSTAIEGRTKKCCSKRSNRPKVRSSENIEKLMKLILAQGATIQTQLLKLKEREQQIENIEVERHKERTEKNGRNYLLETYLESLKEAEAPVTDEEKGDDSGVHTEAGSEQAAHDKHQNALEPLTNSSEGTSRRGRGSKLENQHTPSERAPRSKSETRSTNPHSKNPLVRTHSAHAVTESCQAKNSEEIETKEDEEDFVELRRVQSQVEMWEKVLKINKKLEKEEENLVKLHIQIRRIQSENIKIAKDRSSGDPITESLQTQLDALRTDLDHNSKEIYRNFTQLIQQDEQVVKKQNHLTELIQHLEHTDHEHNLLTDMATSPAAAEPLNIGISLQVKGQEKTSPPDLIPAQAEVSTPDPPPQAPDPTLQAPVGQRCEQSTKPKILKISFDETVIQADAEGAVHTEKDPSPVLTRNIKGILKNRNSETFHVGDLEKVAVNYGSNISSNDVNPKIEKTTCLQKDNPPDNPYQLRKEVPSYPTQGIKNQFFIQGHHTTTDNGNRCGLPGYQQPPPVSGYQPVVQGYQPVGERLLVPSGYQPERNGQPHLVSEYQLERNVQPHPTTGYQPEMNGQSHPISGYQPERNGQSHLVSGYQPEINGQSHHVSGYQQVVERHPLPVTGYHQVGDRQTPLLGYQHLPPQIPGCQQMVSGYQKVATKAIVHNDVDSSGSSDTSGLSSMYSASPTVEEPTYVFNTLV